jgi:NAD(P)H-hydrate repair Nnr-like enzyme with NAD(P)H-hydrate epimerase domain
MGLNMRTDVPGLTADHLREVDRVRVEDLPIELIQGWRTRGRSLAELAVRRFSPASAVVPAGRGGNGGGMVATWHLPNRGCAVSGVFSELNRLTRVPAHQADILTRLGHADD